ncbi:MAG: amino acid adenylation domain-containing protein, partial [Polyangiales bacterium]
QVLVSTEAARLDEAAWPNLRLRELALPPPAAQFDLGVELHDDGRGIAVLFKFRRARLDETLVARMLESYQRILGLCVEQPEAPLAHSAQLGPGEQAQLVQWHATQVQYAGPLTLSAALGCQLARTPSQPALRFGAEQLSYRALYARADGLANELRRRGVGRDTIVAVCMARSVELVVALLGVIRAGAAYLPLDPELPPDRLAFMVRDAGATLGLCQARFAGLLEGVTVLCVDEPSWPEATVPLEVTQEPSDLAYVIYTSGSTGEPKGVLCEHGGLMNRLHWMQAEFALDATDRVLQKTPYSFDVSVWEFFWPLLAGAELVVAEPGLHRDSKALCELVQQAEITTLHFVPSMLGPFVDEPSFGSCSSVRQVFASGEALPAEVVNRFQSRHTSAELINLYGPTEASIDVSCYRCPRGVEHESVPIGWPVANTQLHVLDAGLRPVPLGAAGDLYIGGVQLARGYLNRPELTAERFREHAGQRLYQTGDRARQRSDGAIEYLGRSDDQVKLRGFRIELGEISHALTRMAAVREAAVALVQTPAPAQLVAYVVLEEGQPFDPTGLLSSLSGVLPAYMVPSQVIALERLPTTRHGKLDRKALPTPQRIASTRYEPPHTPAEQVLCELMQQLLKVERVGIHDNFFALGGDSIVSLQLVARARERGILLNAKQIFTQRTVSELAAAAGSSPQALAESGSLRGPVPLLPIQRWFFAQPLARPHHWNVSILLTPRAPLAIQPLTAALLCLVEHHDALRLRFTQTADGVTQHYGEPERAFTLSQERLANLADLHAVTAPSVDQLDLTHGPLLRAALIELPDGGQRLFLTAHHLVTDELSWRILLDDLTQSYDACARGESPRLPAKTSSYRQWAERTHALAATLPPLSAAEDNDADEVALAWPIDDPAAPNLTSDEHEASASLSADETQRLLDDVASAFRASVEELILTALTLAMPADTHDGPLQVDLESHGRHARFDDLDVSRTVGWFTTLYPVQLTVSERADLAGCVRAVKTQLRAAASHALELSVRRYLSPDATPSSGSPVLFNYLGRRQDSSRDGMWSVASEPLPPDVAPENTRSHELELVAAVVGGELQISWRASARRWRPAGQAAALRRLMAELRRLIAHARAGSAEALSPSDFPLAQGLRQGALDKLLNKLQSRR